MFIKALPTGPFDTNAYVVGCPETREAAIIDPGVGSSPLIFDCISAQRLVPTAILITHSHWDHIAEVAEVKEKFKVPVYIHKADSPNLSRPGADRLPCWIPISGVNADQFLEEGQTIRIGNIIFEVISTPGHTPGGVCFYSKEHNTLFSGDTLFKGTIGNLSFPTAEPDKMWTSLDKLAKLPPETKVFPGHGPETTIGQENWLPKAKEIFNEY